jgi:hypothetical protein
MVILRFCLLSWKCPFLGGVCDTIPAQGNTGDNPEQHKAPASQGRGFLAVRRFAAESVWRIAGAARSSDLRDKASI